MTSREATSDTGTLVTPLSTMDRTSAGPGQNTPGVRSEEWAKPAKGKLQNAHAALQRGSPVT